MADPAHPQADAHLHLFSEGYRGRYGRSPAGGDELANYDGFRSVHEIVKGLVVGFEGPGYRGNNEYLASLAPTQEWIAPVAYLPADSPPRVGKLQELWRQGFVGVSFYLLEPDTAADWSRWPHSTWAELNARHAVVSLNCSPEAATVAFPVIAQLGGSCVLFSHLGLPGRAVCSESPTDLRARLEPILQLTKFPHVGVKLSGLYAISDPPHAYPHGTAGMVADLILDGFGPNRLYWGSDYPCCLDAVSFPQTLDLPILARLDADERQAVVGGNLLQALSSLKG